MRDIDPEYLPTFKYFQFKKSTIDIKEAGNSSENIGQTMLCFSDVSSKIMYDTKKAEGELLTLINSTISHEMRNPLNSIINQCKILFQLGINITGMLTEAKPHIPGELYEEIIEQKEEIDSSTKVMTTSSNLLLLNVEDILGYAQLQAGRFVKVIRKINIKKVVNEIMSI